MSRRSPEDIQTLNETLFDVLKSGGPQTKEELKVIFRKSEGYEIDHALRALVKQRKVRKKGKTRAMVYTAK